MHGLIPQMSQIVKKRTIISKSTHRKPISSSKNNQLFKFNRIKTIEIHLFYASFNNNNKTHWPICQFSYPKSYYIGPKFLGINFSTWPPLFLRPLKENNILNLQIWKLHTQHRLFFSGIKIFKKQIFEWSPPSSTIVCSSPQQSAAVRRTSMYENLIRRKKKKKKLINILIKKSAWN